MVKKPSSKCSRILEGLKDQAVFDKTESWQTNSKSIVVDEPGIRSHMTNVGTLTRHHEREGAIFLHVC